MAPQRDTLFLLPSDFLWNGRREYCAECAEIWGYLSYYPSIKEGLNLEYETIERPRKKMVRLLGPENQNCPTLLLAEESPSFDDCGIALHDGRRFINNARDIGRYFAQRFGTSHPRGS